MAQQNKKQPKPKTGLARCLELASGHKGLVFLAGVLAALAAICSFVPYLSIYYIIREILFVYPDMSLLNVSTISTWGWLALAGILGNIVFYFFALLCSHVAAFGTLYELKVAFADHIMQIPLGYHLTLGSGKMRKIMDENIESVEKFIAHQLPDFVASLVAPLVLVIILLGIDWRYGVVCLVGIVLAFICLLLVFLAAAGKLFGAYLKYQKGDVSYEKLQEYVQEPEEEESPESEKEKEEPKNRYLEIDFAGLKAVNPDVIAWIQIPALDISYPVVQGKDNAYYLHHLFSGESNINGSIFVDCHNQPDFTDQNTIVYGHNMKNGSMFGTLDKYQDKELFEQHPEFYLYLPDKILKYRIFSCYAGRTGSEGYRYHFPEAEDFQTFLDTVSSYRDYDTGTELSATDRIVTLSTCVNSRRNYRYLVHGKLSSEIITEE